LARNKINDVGAWELSEALKVNRTLTCLDLTRNNVEEVFLFFKTKIDLQLT
jgi:hypothetical protein